eukprot:366404-Chlamydomonas_euryale.AAC.6
MACLPASPPAGLHACARLRACSRAARSAAAAAARLRCEVSHPSRTTAAPVRSTTATQECGPASARAGCQRPEIRSAICGHLERPINSMPWKRPGFWRGPPGVHA